MRFEVEQDLPGTRDEVLQAMADASWYEAVSDTPSDWAPRLIAVEDVGDVTVATVRYQFRGNLNKAASAVLDPSRLVHVDTVKIDTGAGTFVIEVKPEHLADRLSVAASGTVRGDGDGCSRVLRGEVKIRYPIVGGQVERAVVSGLLDHAEHERRAFPAWVAAYRRSRRAP